MYSSKGLHSETVFICCCCCFFFFFFFCFVLFVCLFFLDLISNSYWSERSLLQNDITWAGFYFQRSFHRNIGQNELYKVGMLSSKDKVVQLKLNHVFKIFNDTCPHCLKFDFTRVSSLHKYNTRGSPFNFVVPLAKGQARFTLFIALLITIGTHCQMRSRASVTFICSRN